jgi:hypothetical protein
MSWTSFELPIVPSALTTAAKNLGTVAQTTGTVLTVLKNLLKTLAALEINSLSISQKLIQTAVKTIEDNLKTLLSDSGVYVLHVPPRKRVEIPAVVQAAMSRAGLSDLPPVQLSTSLLALDASLGEEAKTSLRRILQANGGNLGFCRTVLESLTDSGDANRPQPLDTDYVYALYVVAGSDDYRQLLEFMSLTKILFSAGSTAIDSSSPGIPSPQNIRARQVVNGASPGALIEWDYSPAIINRPNLSLVIQIKRVAVVRAQEPSVLSASTFKQLFGSASVTKGLKVGTVEVIDIQDYNPLAPPRSALDLSSLVNGQDYYYAAGFELSLGDNQEIAQGQGAIHTFDRLSNWSKLVSRSAPARTAAGTPPDWIRTPSVMSLMPELSTVLQTLVAQVTQLAGQASGFGDLLKDQVSYLEQEIEDFESTASNVLAKINQLTGLLSGSIGSAGAYIRTTDGRGGLPFLTEDLTHAFQEDSAPPFTHGTEFVTGMVILAHASSSAALTPVKTALNLLFGNGGSAVSAVRQAIAQIDVELAQVENLFVEETPVVEAVRVGEDDDGIKDLNCPPLVIPDIVFDDDLTPRE